MRTILPLIPPARFSLLAVILCLFLLALCAACGKSQSPPTSTTETPVLTSPPPTTFPMPPVTSPHQARAAERGWTMLDGRRASLSNHAGRVVVLDFYATWCVPCREQVPHLVEMQRRYGARGLNVIGLNVGGPEDRYAVPQFVEEFEIQYGLGFPDAQMVELYMSDNSSIPQTYVFDRSGLLVKRFIGYDPTMPAELERIVQTALAAKAE